MISARTLLAGMVLTTAMLAQPASAKPDQRIVDGHALATQRCGRCHSVEKAGLSPNPAAPPFRTLGRDYPVESLDEALAEGILVGHAGMPDDPWETTDINRFIVYLESISEPMRAMKGPPKGSKRLPAKSQRIGNHADR